jgi:lipoate-protein ligase B
VEFGRAAALQETLRDRLLAAPDAGEWLLLCEHPAVITLGRRARREHVLLGAESLAARGIALEAATRGGDVTYHGPGQLVGYPVFRLRRGVLAHVEAAARAVVEVLAGFGVAAAWRRDCPGVWVQDEKICAFGVHVRRGVAIHGFALNVDPDLGAFGAIVPCGLPGVRPTSLARLGVRPPPLATVARLVAGACARAYGRELVESASPFTSGSLPAFAPSRPVGDCQGEEATYKLSSA